MFGLEPGHLIVILIIILVLFGGKKIPEVMRGLGEGLAEFKKASHNALNDITAADEKPAAKPDDAAKS